MVASLYSISHKTKLSIFLIPSMSSWISILCRIVFDEIIKTFTLNYLRVFLASGGYETYVTAYVMRHNKTNYFDIILLWPMLYRFQSASMPRLFLLIGSPDACRCERVSLSSTHVPTMRSAIPKSAILLFILG